MKEIRPIHCMGEMACQNYLYLIMHSTLNSSLALFVMLFFFIGYCKLVSFVVIICFRNCFQMTRAVLRQLCSRDTIKFSFSEIGHSSICFHDLNRKPATKISREVSLSRLWPG